MISLRVSLCGSAMHACIHPCLPTHFPFLLSTQQKEIQLLALKRWDDFYFSRICLESWWLVYSRFPSPLATNNPRKDTLLNMRTERLNSFLPDKQHRNSLRVRKRPSCKRPLRVSTLAKQPFSVELLTVICNERLRRSIWRASAALSCPKPEMKTLGEDRVVNESCCEGLKEGDLSFEHLNSSSLAIPVPLNDHKTCCIFIRLVSVPTASSLLLSLAICQCLTY